MTFFAQNLSHLRKQKKISQETASFEIEIHSNITFHRARLASYEEGRAEAPYELLVQLADYYKVTLDQLLKTDLKNEAES